MKTFNGNVPHYVQVQMGRDPDLLRDGQACIHLPLDETADGVGMQLANIARAISSASNIMTPTKESGVVINVDGSLCNIPITKPLENPRVENLDGFAQALSKLVAPAGWNPA